MSEPWTIRRSSERGRLHNRWLEARFSFSFGSWRDARWDRYGPLLALNEDVVQPGTGFAMHPHADLEILIVPHAGAVEHRDSEGGHGLVQPGEVQMMRAGRGIRHSQMNPSADLPDHHFQIWIEPRRRGLAPLVRQRRLAAPVAGQWMPVAGPEGTTDGPGVDQDLHLSIGTSGEGRALHWEGRAGRSQYLHLMAGAAEVAIGDTPPRRLQAGDAIAFFAPAPPSRARGMPQARWLLFDLPSVSPAPAVP